MSNYPTWEDIDLLANNSAQEVPEDGAELVERTAWAITDDGSADWAIERIAEERAEADRLIAIATDRIAELQARIAGIQKRTESRTGYLTMLLREYMATVPENRVKATKTQAKYPLLSGDLVWKYPAPKVEHDDEALIPWVAENAPDFVEQVPKLAWGELKKSLEIKDGKAISPEGEVVPGITVTEQPPRFEVKTRD